MVFITNWWRFRNMILFPMADGSTSALLAIAGFVIAIGILPLAVAYPLGWIATGLAFAGGVTYFTDHMIKKYLTYLGTIPERDVRPEDFLNAPIQRSPEYRFVVPVDATESQLYPYVDLSHHCLYIRAENDLSRKQRLHLYQRWYYLCPSAFLHLEKLLGSEWRPIAVSIVLPLSMEGYAAIVDGGGNTDVQSSVVNLGPGGIPSVVDRRHRIVLIDTWIVDRTFKSEGHGKSQMSGGFANAMVLRHIAQFWNSKCKFPRTTFLVESNNAHLIPALRALAFYPSGRSQIKAGFYRLETTILRCVRPREFERLTTLIAEIERISIHQGTAAFPSGWVQDFPPRG